MTGATETKVGLRDRKVWPRGPWDDEPQDRVEWVDDATGLRCLIVRNEQGAWCGYVAVPAGHPWHGLGHPDLDHVDVHDKVTWNGPWVPLDPFSEWTIDPDAASWVGFSCQGAYDLYPVKAWVAQLKARPDNLRGLTYRTQAFAMEQAADLARQAHDAATTEGRLL